VAYILDQFKLAYFPVPKIACTSLKCYFHELEHGAPFVPYRNDDGRMVHIHNKIFSKTFCAEDQAERLAACHRIAVIRDPIERLVSAYANRVLFHRELSEAALDTPVARALALAADPPFELFMERFDEYRVASWSIAHHTNPAAYFLGPDLGFYDKIYKFSELAQLHADVSALTGTQYALPHEQKMGAAVTLPGPKHKSWRKLREFYAGDYALMRGYYQP
jgi:hypothetical protein